VLDEMPDRRFRRRERLKKRADITRVFKKGRVISCTGIKLFFLPNQLSYNRIVITFARKYGNAVKRNRARRLCREAYRLMKEGLKTGYDLVLLSFPRAAEAGRESFNESAGQLKTLFRKAGIGVWPPGDEKG
jgi:ribonuclease P protein component